MPRILFLCLLSFFFLTAPTHAEQQMKTIIIEVEGEVEEHLEYIKTYHPFLRIITTYSTIFNGIALEGKLEHFLKIEADDFVKEMHDVQQYQAEPLQSSGSKAADRKPLQSPSSTAPATQPTDQDPAASQTGRGIKVAVIDTGIDYNHPDLMKNYTAGYDVFDFDADPMETLPEEGMPTNHGTHVAGIIAADGELRGVAPDAEIYAYRALGPGGFGSTVHVLAALEQAVQDEVDIINLSLGNQVNGPDYPTSIAVNKTVDLGIPVVIANGNSGPESWTVGAPATAENALSIGAATKPKSIPKLYDRFQDNNIQLISMLGAPAWKLPHRDYQIINAENQAATLTGKIAVYQREDVPFRELALDAQERGAKALLIYNNEDGIFQGDIDNEDQSITIPVAGISQTDGEWLLQHEGTYIEILYEEADTTIASFSSRGPVTVNWQMKPDLLAPGTDITSTVPGGYEMFNGTSMAAPYVSGAIALIKEVHPDWEPEKIYHALKTTAVPLLDEGNKPIAPHIQGYGHIRTDEAIETETIIYDDALQLGRVMENRENKSSAITIENLSEKQQQFTFQSPKNQKGISWKLPLSFTLDPNTTKDIEIAIDINSKQLDEGIHDGYLTLIEQTENKMYHLPYLFVNQSPGQPKTYGFEFEWKQFSEDTYVYRFYATEALESFNVDLYDPDTLTHQGRIVEEEEIDTGMNEGEIHRDMLTPGIYSAVLSAKTAEGNIEQEEVYLIIE